MSDQEQVPQYCVKAHERIASLETTVEQFDETLKENTKAVSALKDTIIVQKANRKIKSRLYAAIIALCSGAAGYFTSK